MPERARTILVIDDHPTNLKLMRVLLESEGYATITTESAEAALDLLREQRPDLILTDVQLHGMDGLALTRLLKADAASAAIPVIAVSAFAHAEDRARALAAGCSAYFSKPLDTRAFYAALAGLMT